MLRYRADFTNLLNCSDLGNINAAIGSANLGATSESHVGQRYISMGVRLEF